MVRTGHAGDIRRLMSRHAGFSIAGVVAVLLLMATATIVAASSIEAPRCDGVKLRAGPSTADAVRAVIGTTTTVTVDTQVSGSAWQTLCAGHVLSGSKWARISSVDGTTVEAKFGVPYVYAAAGLLQVVATASPSATARPTAPPPSPTPSPTVAPPTAPAATEAPPATPSPPAASAPASTAPVATQAASAAPSAGPAGPGTTQTGSPSDPLNNPAAEIVLVLAVLSTTLSWFAVADRRRRRARRVAVPDSVPASRLEDVLH